MTAVIISNPRKNVFAVVDIGSSKLVCFIVHLHYHRSMKVIGYSHKASAGIKNGTIINVKQARDAISSCIAEAEKNAGESVDQIYVCINGCGIRDEESSASIHLSGGDVSEKDKREVIYKVLEQYSGGDIIIHGIPVEYQIDDIKEVTDPCGMQGDILSVNLKLIVANSVALMNLEKCINKCNIDVAGYIANGHAIGKACLTKEEMQVGTTIIDIGDTSTSVTVFKDSKPVFIRTIPIGGLYITQDIAWGLSIGKDVADKIKNLYGDVIITADENNDIIEVEQPEFGQDHERLDVKKSELNAIIRPRVEEIIEMIKDEFDKCGFKITQRVVVAGGTSQLSGVKEMVGYILGGNVRIGEILSYEIDYNELKSLPYASVTGSLSVLNDIFYSDNAMLGNVGGVNNSLLSSFFGIFRRKNKKKAASETLVEK